MEKKLQVRNLTISFRTSNGKVQAVRGIDFDLQKGETLAIVGESGSGKSVTSKAILGILAANAIIEGGEIIYDGKDLLKISEDEFHKIRGDKIAMIFQDPMSSLNPIVKIGRQLTEAMILKGKARQRESRAAFNGYLKLLGGTMTQGAAAGDPAKAEQIKQKCEQFNKFEYKHLELEAAYNKAHDAAEEASGLIGVLIFELEKDVAKDLNYRVSHIAHLANLSVQDYVVKDKAEELTALAKRLPEDLKRAKKDNDHAAALRASLARTGEILDEALEKEEPNFFTMGYFLTFSGQPLPDVSVAEMNAVTRKYMDEHFMLDFIDDARQGLQYSAARAYEKKAACIQTLRAERAVFTAPALDRKACREAQKKMAAAVEASIDRLEFVKDSQAYVFPSALMSEIDRYFSAIGKNAREEKRFARQTARYERAASRRKSVDWEVAPKSLTDLETVRGTILRQIDSLAEHYEEQIARKDRRDFDAEAVAAIDHLKASASGVVNKVTKAMAKEKAIKLMEEVGIPEPRKRYNQYPFEFSGGMRQRIVIAIALAANPDILICDEPTTALDVTIQSQILELINKLKRERHLSVIFITHDLGVVANMADRIAVMYAGKIVEYGTSEEVFYHAAHPYTWALLASMPDLDTNEKLDAIPGTPPNMIYPPAGDAFAPRNKYAMQIDFERQPPMFRITDTHYAATWLLHPDAPKVDPPRIITERIARMKQIRGSQDAE